MSRIISEELWDDLDEYIIRTRRDANECDLLKEADRLRDNLRNAHIAPLASIVSLDAIADVINENSDIDEVYPLARAIQALLASNQEPPHA